MLTFSNGVLYEFTDSKESIMASSRIPCYKIMGCDDILMKQVKGMKFLILIKLLQDDSKENGMRYIYLHADTGCCEVMSYGYR